MGRFSNMKVKTKLIGGFLVVAAIAALTGGVGQQYTRPINTLAPQK